MSQNQYHILIAEDNLDLLRLLSDSLKQKGYTITEVSAASLIEDAMTSQHHDLVILDLLMPGTDIITQLQQVRRLTRSPILILTSLREMSVLSQCLALGADDFVTKPFNFNELHARIAALLRLSYLAHTSSSSTGGRAHTRLLLVNEPRSILVDGIEHLLTAQEYEVLDYFMTNPNRVVSLQQLQIDVWGDESYGRSAVTNVINRIRHKIEANPSNPDFLLTVRGQGYLLKLA